MIGCCLPSFGERQLSVRVIRWGVAVDTTFAAEHLLAPRHYLGRCHLGIPRRLERHEINTDRVEQLVGIPEANAALLVGKDAMRSKVERIGAGDERSITRYILGSAEAVGGGGVEIAAEAEILKVGDLADKEGTRVGPRKDA